MNKSQKAVELFDSGFNCSQSVFAAFAEDFGVQKEEALKIATSFGGGMAGMRETCGAVTGAFMVLGLKYGKTNVEDNETKELNYAKVKEFTEEFTRRHNFLKCGDLKNQQEVNGAGKTEEEIKTGPDSCQSLVSSAAEILTGLLKD